MNRDQMEAHLTLQGWQPTVVGSGGAFKGDMHVYTYDSKLGVRVATQMQSTMKATDKLVDAWFMADRYFWPMAHYIKELNHAAHDA